MAAIFNGSTSDLSATVSSTAISYPVLISCWVKPLATTANYTLVSASDDGAGGSLDALVVSARGDQSGDPVWAQSIAAGSASNAADTAFSGQVINEDGSITWRWQHVVALFLSESHRRIRIGDGDWGSVESTSRAVGNVTKWSIGSLHNSGATTRFAGRIEQVGVWQGISEDRAMFAAEQLRSMTPDRIWYARDNLFIYQRLRGGVNDSNYSAGPAMTGSNLTFDSADFYYPLSGPGDELGSTTDPERRAFRWPDYADNIGPLPSRRIVTLDENGRLELAANNSTNWIGATEASGRLWSRQWVSMRSAGRIIRVEPAGGATFAEVGATVATLADDGKVDSEGTIGVGIVSRVDSRFVEIIPF